MNTGRPCWRPLKFENVEILQKKMDEYFSTTPIEERTITWLAVFLDTSRETLTDYEKRDEFSDTIKKGKDKVEYSYELSLRKRGSAGDIFWLKNFGWKDKQEIDNNHKGLENITIKLPNND